MSHALPVLPYAYNALEPHIDTLTMETHHSKHHQAYVNNLNAALAGTGLESTPLEDLLATILSPASPVPAEKRNAVRNNGGGHWNHSLFWEIIAPTAAPTAPSTALMAKINEKFGSFADFQAQWKTASLGIFGSGWIWLVVQNDGSLEIMTTANQDNPLMYGYTKIKPIVAYDWWEHAYYLKHKNVRANAVDDSWNVINWDVVSQRYHNAIAP